MTEQAQQELECARVDLAINGIATEQQVTQNLCPECGWEVGVFRYHACNPEQRSKYIASLRSCCDRLEKERNAALARCHELKSRNKRLKRKCGEEYDWHMDAVKKWHHVTAERDEAMARCKDIAWTLDRRNKYIISLEIDETKLTQEHDEARQWARKLYKTDGLYRIRHAERGCELRDLRRKLEDQYEIARQEYKENSKLRGCLNKTKETWLEALGLWKRMRITIEQQRDRAGVENADLRAQLAEARNKALDEAGSAAKKMLFRRFAPYEIINAVYEAIRALKS